MKIDSKLIYNLAFFSIIFMYFRILPINIETQPIFILLLIPFFNLLKKDFKFIIKKEEKALIIHLFIIILYFLIGIILNSDEIFVWFLKFILGPISYIFILKNVELLKVKTLEIMTIILFLVALINLTHIPVLYSTMNNIISIFFGRYNIGYIGARGLSILTPEPSYFMYFAMLLLFSFEFVEYKDHLKEKIFYKIIIIIMGLLTKSALVYIIILIYIFYRFILGNKKINIKKIIKNILLVVALVIVFLIVCKIFSIDFVNNRFYQIINIISFNNIFDVLFFGDESAGFRFIINTIYIISILIKPFGFGLGGLESNWSTVAKTFDIDYRRNGIFIYTFNDASKLSAQAYFPNVVGAIGILSIFILIFTYKNNKLKNKKLKYTIITIITLFMWFLQSNMYNPVFWILIGFCKYERKKEDNIL